MQSLQSFKEPAFPLGYNDKYPASALPKGYCALIKNGFLSHNKVQERNGYTEVGTSTGTKPNLGLHSYETGSTKQILKINDNATGTVAELQYWNGATWTTVATPTFTAGLVCSMVTVQGVVYISNGTDTVKKWNGTTLVDVVAIPKGKYLKWYHGYLWSLHTTTYKSRAYFSDLYDPENYPAANLLDINADDGDFLTGAGAIKDELVFAKQYRMYSFQGWLEDTFTYGAVNERLSSYGATSFESFINTGNDLIFSSFGGDIPHFRSLTRTRFADTEYGGIITDDITGTMSTINKGYLYKISCVFDGTKVYIFFPKGSSTYNDTVVTLDTVTKGFAYHTGIYAARGIISTISGSAEVYFADSRNSKVYMFDTSNTDDGELIDFQFVSAQLEPDFKRFAKFKYLFLQYDTGIATTFDAYTSVNAATFDLQETIDLTGDTPSVFPAPFPFIFGLSNQGQTRIELPYGSSYQNIQLKIAKMDDKARMTLTEYEFMGYLRKIRDLD